MNQIPNIEETHNTREVKDMVTHLLMATNAYGYFSEKGITSLRQELSEYLHHQLQKAREEERERIMRWTSENYSRSTQPLYAHVDLLNLQNFIRQPDHSELDQGKKYTMGVDFAKRDHSELDQDVTGK